MKKIISFSVYFFFFPNLFAIQWPLKDFNTEHYVSGTLGGWRKSNVHDGTDILGAAGTPVYVVEDGTVQNQNATSICSPNVQVGDYWYIHIVADDKKYEINKTKFKKGERIGVILDQEKLRREGNNNCSAGNHLHFGKGSNGAEVNTLSTTTGLSPYYDKTSPIVREVQFFYRESSTTVLDLSKALDAKEIRIKAYIRDIPNDTRQNTAPYTYGYQVFDAKTDALLVDQYPKITFDSVAGKLRQFIYPIDEYYWVTNKGNADDFLDLRKLPFAEEYKLCVLAQDIQLNGGDVDEQKGAECHNFKVLNSTFAWITSPAKDDPENKKWKKYTSLHVQGVVQNPGGVTKLEVLATRSGNVIDKKTFDVAAGAENKWATTLTFASDFEERVQVAMLATSGEQNAKDSVEINVDNKGPAIASTFQAEVKTNKGEYSLQASVLDEGSGLQTFSIRSVSQEIKAEQHAASGTQLITPLPLGDTLVDIVASDVAGNESKKTVKIARGGNATLSGLGVVEYECGKQGIWSYLLSGTPGLKATILESTPKSHSKFTEAIDGGGKIAGTISGTTLGQYSVKAIVRDWSGSIVMSGSASAALGACRADPTYVVDTENDHVDQAGQNSDLIFSPTEAVPTIDINFESPYRQSDVKVGVRDNNGKIVANLLNETKAAGFYSVAWDGKDAFGVALPEGDYMVTVEAEKTGDPSMQSIKQTGISIDRTAPAINLIRLEGSSLNPLMFNVWASAVDEHLSTYKLSRVQYVGESTPPIVTPIVDSADAAALAGDTPVSLISIDANGWDEGLYYIRLDVTDAGGNHTATHELEANDSVPQGMASLPFTVTKKAGIRSAHLSAEIFDQTAINGGSEKQPPDNPSVFFDDDLPSGADAVGNWEWSSLAYSGQRSHLTSGAAGALNDAENRFHYFIHADPGLPLTQGQRLIQYVYLDGSVREIMLQYYTDKGDGEHRVYWGANEIQTSGIKGSASLISAGALPPAGRWVRLKIPVELLDLDGRTVKGILFASAGGSVLWDKSTTSNGSLDAGGLSYSLPPASNFDDSTTTQILYSLDQAVPIRVDVVSSAGKVIRTLVDGAAGDPACCTVGDHIFSWDQKTSGNTPSPDGNYAFLVTSASGPLNTENFSLNPAFQVSTTTPPSLATTAFDLDGNQYVISVASPTRVIKINSVGLPLATVVTSSRPIKELGLDASGSLIIKSDDGNIQQWQAARIPFQTKNLTAIIRVPWRNTLVKATVPIIGAASARNFKNYTVDVGPGWDPAASSWQLLQNGNSKVEDSYEAPVGFETLYGNLATWETGLTSGEEYPSQDIFHPQTLPVVRGRWQVRLSVFQTDNSSKTAVVPVYVGRVINNATGGIIRSDDDLAQMTLPALSVNSDWEVFGLFHNIPPSSSVSTATLQGVAPFLNQDLPPIPPEMMLAGRVYEFFPAGTFFHQPVRLQVESALSHPLVSDSALYEWNEESQRWGLLSRDEKDLESGSSIFIATVTSVRQGRALYAILSAKDRPASPLLYEVTTPRTDQHVSFMGRGTPGAEVVVFSLEISSNAMRVITKVNNEGFFTTPPFVLVPGNYQFAAIQTEVGQTISGPGSVSDPSASVTVEISTRPQPTIFSINFTDAEYRYLKLNSFSEKETIHVRLRASDSDPLVRNEIVVRLHSGVTDPTGIRIPLKESEESSGEFVGDAHVGTASNSSSFTIGATKKGELIEVIAEDDPSKRTSLYFNQALPPPAPLIYSVTHPSLVQQTFEDGLGDWRSYDTHNGATISLSTSAATGLRSVHLEQSKENGNFSAMVTDKPYDIRKFPILSFDARTGSDVRFNLFFKYKSGWLEFILNDIGELPKSFPPSFDVLGSYVPNQSGLAVSGSAWQHVEINLYEYFRRKYPDAMTDADFRIDAVILGDWTARPFYGMVSGNTPLHSWAEFDNFMITNAGEKGLTAEFSWLMAGGHTDISGFSLLIDESSSTIPYEFITHDGYVDRESNMSSGEHYLHIRARDTNENWGPANHFKFLVDRDPPFLSHPTPEPNSRSTDLTAQVQITDPVGYGLDPDSIKFTVNGKSFDSSSQALSYDGKSGVLTILLGAIKPRNGQSAPTFVDGQLIALSIDDATDWAGNHLREPFSWSWQADFSRFSGGDFAPLTINGGREAAWAPDGLQLAFISDRSGQSELYVMMSTDAAEAGNTARALTNSVALKSHPSWSPNGKWIAFAEDTGGMSKINVIPSVGGTPRVLTSGNSNDQYPVWSKDGTQLVFSRGVSGLANLVALNIDPNSASVLSEKILTHDEVGYNFEAAYSAGGTALYYHQSLYQDYVYIAGKNGDQPRKLTLTGKDYFPAVKPDGTAVTFVSKRASEKETLWTMDPDGRNQRVLLDNQNLWSDTQPSWAPDGSRLAFSTLRSGAWNIWILSSLQVNEFKVEPTLFSPASTTGLTTTSIRLAVNGAYGRLTLKLRNLATQQIVRTLLDSQSIGTGAQTVVWDGKNDGGTFVDDGTYEVVLTVDSLGTPEPIIKIQRVTIDQQPPVSVTNVRDHSFISTNTAIAVGSGKVATVFVSTASEAAPSSFLPYNKPYHLMPGTQTIHFYGLDVLGNLESTKSATFYVDGLPPVASYEWSGPQLSLNGKLFISSVTALSAIAKDAAASGTIVSGLQSFTISVGAEAWGAAQGSSTLTVFPYGIDGKRDTRIIADDAAGNRTEVRFPVYTDLVAPMVAVNFNPPAVWNGVRNVITPATQISFSVDDRDSTGGTAAASGADRLVYKKDGQDPLTLSTSTSVSITELGDHDVFFSAIDRMANESMPIKQALRVASQAPLSQLIVEGGKEGAIVSPETRFFVRALEGALIDHLEAKLDGGIFKTVGENEPLQFATGGEHIVAFRAVQKDLSPEPEDFMVVQVDTGVPVTEILISTSVQVSATNVRVRKGSEITLRSVDAGMPAAGIAQQYFSVNNATHVYTRSFTLESLGLTTEDLFEFSAWGVDRVQQQGVPVVETLDADNGIPSSTFSLTGPRYDAHGKIYISSATTLSIAAIDGGARPSGISSIQVSTTSGQFFAYQQPLQFDTQGSLPIELYAVDRVGNQEPKQTLPLSVDLLPPVLSLSPLGESLQVGATLYIHPQSSLVITAPDDDSGFLSAQRSIDGSEFAESKAPFVVPSGGLHFVGVRGIDRVLNQRTQLVPVFVESQAPLSSFFIIGSSVAVGTTTYIAPTSRVALQAFDVPEVSQGFSGSSGVKNIFYQLDGELTSHVYENPLSLPNGLHAIRIRAEDNLGNIEVPHIEMIFVDPGVANTRVQFVPAAFFREGLSYISTSTVVQFIASNERSGVSRLDVQVEGNSTLFFSTTANASVLQATMTFVTPGLTSVQFHMLDLSGNTGPDEKISFVVDNEAPHSQLFIDGVETSTVSPVQVNPATLIAIVSTDSLSGVKNIYLSVNGSGFLASAGLLRLSTGTHQVNFFAVDQVGVHEEIVSVTFLSTAGVVSLPSEVQASVKFFPAPYQNNSVSYISTSTLMQISGAPAAEISGLDVNINGSSSSFATSVTTLTFFNGGSHSVEFRATNLSGQMSATQKISFLVDNQPPQSTLLLNGIHVSGEDLVTSTTTVVAVIATDTASGVENTFISVDEFAFSSNLLTVSLSTGVHTIRFFSVDQVGLIETMHTVIITATTSVVSATPTFKSASHLQFFPMPFVRDGLSYISPTTQVQLIAGSSTSSVSRVEGTVNGRPFVFLSTSPDSHLLVKTMTFTEPGFTVVKFKAIDPDGFSEPEQDFTFVVDDQPPHSELLFDGVRPASSSNTFVSTATLVAVVSTDALSGVQNIYLSVDGASFVETTGSIVLSAGSHELRFFATDAVGLDEAVQSAIVMSVSLGSTPSPSPAPLAATQFEWGEVYVFPNPTRGNVTPVLHVESGLADHVRATIYDVSGDAVYETEVNDAPQIMQLEGTSRYVYEIPLQRAFSSGVYFYFVQSDKSGSNSMKKTGKFSVVK